MVECTIITICYNVENEIKETIESVLKQNVDKKRIEYLFIDGKSTDNTVNIINSYIKENSTMAIRLLSEKDNGIYDAMNKGAKNANGKWIIYINAGDAFASENSLSYLLDFEDKDNYDIIYGNAIQRNFDERYSFWFGKSKDKLVFDKMEFCHQSTLIKRDYQCKNLYDQNYKIAADYNFFVKAFVSGAKLHFINKCISIFSLGGISYTQANLAYRENLKVKLESNLINKKQYNKEMCKTRIKSYLRKIIPKKILEKRQAVKLKELYPDWYSYDEIMKIINN